MSYRDDLAASQARADALEQQLSETQGQVRTLQDELKERDAPPAPEPAAPAFGSPAPGRKRKLGRTVLVVCAIAVAVALIALAWNSCRQKVDGSFVASGQPLGTWEMTVSDCDNGKRRSASGLDLFGPDDAHIRLLETPADDPLSLTQQQELLVRGPAMKASTTVRRRDCTTFDYEAEEAGLTEDGIQGLRGHLEIDCKLEGCGSSQTTGIG